MPKSILKSIKLLLILLSLILISIYAKQSYESYLVEKEEQIALDLKDITKAKDIIQFRKRFANFDMNELFSLPISKTAPWWKNENKRYKKSLKDRNFDLIILPSQGVDAKFDRTSSLLVANELASKVRKIAGLSVAPPELVLRILGERSWRFPDKSVNKLAKQLNANVLHIFTQSYKSNKEKLVNVLEFDIRIAAVLTDYTGRIIKQKVHEVGSNPKEPFIENKIAHVIPNIIKSIFDINNKKTTKPIISNKFSWKLPETLSDFSSIVKSPLDQAAYLQLLALLTPKYFDFERRRLFERSLNALNKVNSSSTNYILLTARAQYHLYRRPVALKLLETNKTAAESALKSYINGNYPALREDLLEIKDELLYAMSFIEYSELHYSYQRREDNAYLLASFKPNWQSLLSAAGRDNDNWYAQDNLELFSSIVGLLPDFDKFNEQIVRGLAVSGELNNEELPLLLLKKLFKPITDENKLVQSYSGSIEPVDSWLVYRNLAIANLLRSIDKKTNWQGLHSRAISIAEMLEPYLEGNLTFSRLYAQALKGISEKASVEDKSLLLTKRMKILMPILDKVGHIDLDYVLANKLLPSRFSKPRALVDFPTGYLKYDLNGQSPALDYTNSNFMVLMSAINRQSISQEEYEQILKKRFDGHPHKYFYMAQMLFKNSRKLDDIIVLLEKALESGNNDWSTYELLANTYSDKGEYKNAKDTYLAFPGFKNPPKGNRVAISNYAADAANKFYWHGRYNEAIELFEIAASIGSGADAEYSSQQRLGLIQGDFNRALYFAYKRGHRYNSSYGFRDYLGLLHLLGDHKNADAGFNELAPRYKKPVIWTAKFIGQRIQNLGVKDIINSTKSYLASINGKQPKEGQRYILMQSFVDRNITNQSIADISKIELTGSERHRRRIKTVLSNIFEKQMVKKYCYPQEAICSKMPSKEEWSSMSKEEINAFMEKHRDKPFPSKEYIGFIEAYSLLNKGQNKKAFDSFMDYDSKHDIFGYSQFALPYFAMTLSDESFSEALPKFLTLIEKDSKSSFSPENFDAELARAIIYAHLGRNEDSMNSLKIAFERRPHTNWRPFFSWYQLTEVAVWLTDKTKDSRFIKKALKWAKDYQVIQPQFAWAYAFEARYSVVRKDRVHAAGIAAYLDPQSQWLSEVPKDIRLEGEKWFKINNPFYLNENTNIINNES